VVIECNRDITSTEHKYTLTFRVSDELYQGIASGNFALISGQRCYKCPECFVLLQLENGVVLGGIGH
jgi:hypothetical protein